LAAPLVVLYGRDREFVSFYRVIDRPLLKSRDEILAMGYNSPRGALYLCLPVAAIIAESGMPTFSADVIRRVAESRQPIPVTGMPIVVSWMELVDWRS
jgi:hypothetical protein